MAPDACDADIRILGTREAMAAGSVATARQLTEALAFTRPDPAYIDLEMVRPPLQPALRRMLAQRHGVFPDRYLLTLHQAIVAGAGCVIINGQAGPTLLRESALELLAREGSPPGFEKTADASLRRTLPLTRHFPEPCLLLKRGWSSNPAHWLVEQAAALALLARHHASPAKDIIVSRVTSPTLLDTMYDVLATILPGARLHHLPDDEAWSFDTLDYLEPTHIPPMAKSDPALQALRHAMLSVGAQPRLTERRLFIFQQPGARVMANEARLAQAAQSRGFVGIETARYTATELAALFANAEAIVGAKSPSMAFSIFAPPGCKLMLLSPGNFIDPFFWDTASRLGQAYAETFARAEGNASATRYIMPETKLAAMLDHVLGV